MKVLCAKIRNLVGKTIGSTLKIRVLGNAIRGISADYGQEAGSKLFIAIPPFIFTCRHHLSSYMLTLVHFLND